MPAVEYIRGPLADAPIVLLPGLFAGGWMWKPVRDHLVARGHSVLWLSEPFAVFDTKTGPIEALRSMLIGVLDANRIQAAILCGNSLGGLLALDVAASIPERVRAAVVSGCPGLEDHASLDLNLRGGISRETVDDITGRLFHDRSAISGEMVARCCEVLNDRRCVVNMMRYARAIRNYDVLCCLAKVECPVLMIWGQNDRMTPVEPWQRKMGMLRDAAIHKIAYCGHAPMIERSAEFNRVLTCFLAGLRGGAVYLPAARIEFLESARL
jgi:pimeloyl-ACP methyl ester carboxylesterase